MVGDGLLKWDELVVFSKAEIRNEEKKEKKKEKRKKKKRKR